ncbi:MAG: TVP38/TMEM64 family protein [Gemmatimonadaceae bacterium]|nr:TVP38/TMEM64 family protein [Gemmatimonadaceae bacterium]
MTETTPTTRHTNAGTGPPPGDAPRPTASPIARIALAVVVLIALVLVGRQLSGQLPRLTAAVDDLGVWGPAAFIGVYALACVAFVPASLLTLAAGALFGVVKGTVFVLLGATLGATGAFLIARYVARDWVSARVQRDARFAAIDAAIAEQGRKVVFLLRLSPVIPFNVLNYALGLTQVRLTDYVVASVGMIPGTVLYVYTGKLASVVVGAAGTAAPPRGPAFYAVLGLGLAATAAVTILVTRVAKRALATATNLASASNTASDSAAHRSGTAAR